MYQFDESGVCTNPDKVYELEPLKKDWPAAVSIFIAEVAPGQWARGYQVYLSKEQNVTSHVMQDGNCATKEFAQWKAMQAAAIWIRNTAGKYQKPLSLATKIETDMQDINIEGGKEVEAPAVTASDEVATPAVVETSDPVELVRRAFTNAVDALKIAEDVTIRRVLGGGDEPSKADIEALRAELAETKEMYQAAEKDLKETEEAKEAKEKELTDRIEALEAELENPDTIDGYAALRYKATNPPGERLMGALKQALANGFEPQILDLLEKLGKPENVKAAIEGIELQEMLG